MPFNTRSDAEHHGDGPSYKGAQEDYPLSFDFRHEAKKWRLLAKWVEKNGARIFDVMP